MLRALRILGGTLALAAWLLPFARVTSCDGKTTREVSGFDVLFENGPSLLWAGPAFAMLLVVLAVWRQPDAPDLRGLRAALEVALASWGAFFSIFFAFLQYLFSKVVWLAGAWVEAAGWLVLAVSVTIGLFTLPVVPGPDPPGRTFARAVRVALLAWPVPFGLGIGFVEGPDGFDLDDATSALVLSFLLFSAPGWAILRALEGMVRAGRRGAGATIWVLGGAAVLAMGGCVLAMLVEVAT